MIEKILRKSLIINLLLVFLIFVIDRVSKIYVIYLDKKFLGPEIYSSKFLNITLIWNEGVAFGLFAFDDKFFYNLITGFIIIVILVLFYFVVKTRGIERYSFLIILGGANGNVFDRFFYSAVPDFIDIHYYNFHWFIFNVADIFVTLGVILLIYIELFLKNKKK